MNTKPRSMIRYLLLFLLISTPLKAETFDIGQLNLDDYKGRVVYLDFWASWCKPCQKSFPWMNALVEKYPSDQFKLITINLDAETAEMNKFLARLPANFDVYHDPSGSLAEKFALQAMPTSFVINRNGKVINKHIGFSSKKSGAVEKEIEDLL